MGNGEGDSRTPVKIGRARSEGTNQGYRLLGELILYLFSRKRKVGYRDAREMIKMEVEAFEEKLSTLSENEKFVSKDFLLDLNILKRKHFVYAAYLASLSSLPILGSFGNLSLCSRAIFTKMAMAVGTKAMDNINDDWQSSEEACDAVGRLHRSLVKGETTIKTSETEPEWVAKAENSTIEMTSWAGRMLFGIRFAAPFSFSLYQRDVERLVEGQRNSFLDRAREDVSTIGKYLSVIAEKSTGSLWVDPDIAYLESHLGGFDQKLRQEAMALRACGDLLTKACLLYDDVVDLLIDIKNNSVNAALIYASENGLIEKERVATMKEEDVIRVMYKNGAVENVLAIGDFLLAKALKSLDVIDGEGPVDVDGIRTQCKVMRLFNMRKLIFRDKSIESIRLGLSMKDAEEILLGLPERVVALNKFIHVPS